VSASACRVREALVAQGLSSYVTATRHPWACLLFVLPLLAIYEIGVVALAPGQPEALRNGADVWMRWALARVGLRQQGWPPALLAVSLVLWAWVRRGDRPQDWLSTWVGMVIESTVLALALWGVSRGLRQLVDELGLPLSTASPPDPTMSQMVCFLGAGIYEEALFRLALFSALCWLFRQGELPSWGATVLAATASALLFAAAHNLGPHGEQFEGTVFMFRTLAGLYFAALFALRGFGVAVGAHAGYDLLVGVIVPSL
jgi:membrane protease YdiL (CAAX protease family)